jgi:hypothetical protein
MSHQGTPNEIEYELRRIGFEPSRVGGLALGRGATREDFLRFLRDIPTGAGFEEFDRRMRALPRPEPVWWASYPNTRPLFSEAEYAAAFAVTMAPEGARIHAAHVMNRQQSSIENHVLGRLSVVSLDLKNRVDACRAEAQARWRAEGHTEDELRDEERRWRESVARFEASKREMDAEFGDSDTSGA